MSEDREKSGARADRVMRSADDGEIIADSKGRGKTPGKRRTDAGRKRIVAFIFWALAIIAEIIAIWTFNNFSVLWPSLAAIAADAVFCITAALFWKQANDMDPPKGKFLKNQFGVIMCLIAFLPIGYVLLKGSKDMPKSSKKVISVVAALAFVLTMGMSIDYNPTTQDDLTQAEQMALEYGGTAYWAKYSKSYHFDPDCQTLLNSKEIFQGTMEQAFELGKSDPCDFCAGGEAPPSILDSIINDEEE